MPEPDAHGSATAAASVAVTSSSRSTCVNAQCARPLEPGARFCPYCAAAQPSADAADDGMSPVFCAKCYNENPADAALCAHCGARLAAESAPAGTPPPGGSLGWSRGSSESAAAPPSRGVATAATAAATVEATTLVLRAGENIWHFEEAEQKIAPGARRPLVIVDEQTVHLAHTDCTLTPEELLRRVRSLLLVQEVPVDAHLAQARWQGDAKEARPRLIASLRNHAYSDVKMILGLDYLGRWASIQMSLGVEPEPLPAPPEPSTAEPEPLPVGAIVLGVIGALIALWGYDQGIPFLLLGSGMVIGAIRWALKFRKEQADALAEERRHRQQRWEQEQERRREEKARERLTRTFKVDDMRLFSTSMREVFQAVVDDIVEKGGQVARIEGGQGGFFKTAEGLGQATAAAAPRVSNAADAGV